MDSFINFILDQSHDLGKVKCKKMFSSYGLYLNDIFFGIVNEGRLYIKTNNVTRKKFEAYGMQPFAPSKKQVLKNYYEVPIEVIEDLFKLKNWILESVRTTHIS